MYLPENNGQPLLELLDEWLKAGSVSEARCVVEGSEEHLKTLQSHGIDTLKAGNCLKFHKDREGNTIAATRSDPVLSNLAEVGIRQQSNYLSPRDLLRGEMDDFRALELVDSLATTHPSKPGRGPTLEVCDEVSPGQLH